ncbi:tRNA lysidine(34) synthetase TilS [Patescibacteria group bacterium]|nr:tRNA lysidine(34) synthetase TilS [Patescibacteria group bacterium]
MFSQIPSRKKLLLALSGGPDSVYLLYKLLEIREENNLTLHLAHLNHNIRGQDSDNDQKFIQNLAKKFNLPLTTKKLAQNNLQTPSEEKLRKQRYQFLEKTRVETQCDYILTAHHQNDQVETIIFNFIRGTGPTGLTGMPFKQGNILRPLLNTTKQEILEYLKKHQIKYRIDKSNQDTKYSRNYIRHKLLPLIKKLNPNPTQSILQLSQIIFRQQDFVIKQTFKSLKRITINSQIPFGNYKLSIDNSLKIENCELKISQPIITLSLKKYHKLHPAIQTEILRTILSPLVPPKKQLTSKIISEINDILNHSRGGSQKILFDTLSISKKNDNIYLRLLQQKI